MNRRDFLKFSTLGVLASVLPKVITNQPYVIEIVDIDVSDFVEILKVEDKQHVTVVVSIDDDWKEMKTLVDSTGRKWSFYELEKLLVDE